MRRLDLTDLVVIASAVLGIPEDAAMAAIDRAKAESALAAPFAGFGDRELFPWPHQKIAVLGYRLARYHPLPDGNKRLAWLAMRMCAELNGYPWRPPTGGEDESVSVMERCAAGGIEEPAFCDWVGERLNVDHVKTWHEIERYTAVVEEHGAFVAFLEAEAGRYLQGIPAALLIVGELAALRVATDRFIVRADELLAGTELAPDGAERTFLALLEMPGDQFAPLDASIQRDEYFFRLTIGSKTFCFFDDVLEREVARALAESEPGAG